MALALPLLDVMRPLRASGACVKTPRMLNIGATLGFYTPSWLPEATGADYEATEYLSILDSHRPRYTILSGLSHEEQTGRQPHSSENTWLTAARHPGTDGFRNTISIDQIAANHLGYVTRFPSVTLGSNTAQSQSYTQNGVMVPAETSAAGLFSQMFLQGTPEEVDREKARLRDGASVLDHLLDETAALQRSLGADDKHTLDAYLGAVRDAELQLAEADAWADRPKPVVAEEQPTDEIDGGFLIRRVRLMFELIPLILETDSSRVINVMLQDHRVVPLDVPGVGEDQHNLSHHGQQAGKIRQLKLVETAIVESFRDLLDELHARQDGGGSLLDQTAVLFGSNLGNASSHEPRRLPILVAGGGFSHGEHVAFGTETRDQPLSNLYVTLLQRMGVETDSFGQSTGALSWGPSSAACPTGSERTGPAVLPVRGVPGSGPKRPRRGRLGVG